MRVVRIFFGTDKFNNLFLDRVYDSKLDDKTNCDNALKFLAEAMDEGHTVAVMSGAVEKAKPTFLNFSKIALAKIGDVAVYQVSRKVDMVDGESDVSPVVEAEVVDG